MLSIQIFPPSAVLFDKNLILQLSFIVLVRVKSQSFLKYEISLDLFSRLYIACSKTILREKKKSAF